MADIIFSSNFRLSEFTSSLSAIKFKINNNNLSFSVVNNLNSLVNNVLQPLRDRLNMPININSGYRCPGLNKRVGGVKNSQHIFGLAADITCTDNLKMLKILQTMDFDQLIVYGDILNPRFIHVSYNRGYNRHQFLTHP